MDKLIEDKRYEDVVDFYDEHVSKLKKIPSTMINALTLSLVRLVNMTDDVPSIAITYRFSESINSHLYSYLIVFKEHQEFLCQTQGTN
jgi:hypothetical protein